MSKHATNQRFIDCVNLLIESKKLKNKSFLANKANISNSKLSEILNKRMNVGVDVLAVLVCDFDISAEWLLIGKEPMLKKETDLIHSDLTNPAKKSIKSDSYTIEIQKKLIEKLELENNLLKKQVEKQGVKKKAV